jgi:adenine-specific DNA-methyltransferase
MRGACPDWDPASPSSWERALGLVRVPLFSATSEAPSWPGECAVLLDGQHSSFVVCALGLGGAQAGGSPFDEGPVSWCWSSCLRHVLLLNPSQHDMYLRRWDAADQFRRFALPASPAGAEKLLAILKEAPLLTAGDVVTQMLRVFRRVRRSLPSKDALDAVRILNGLLLGLAGVRAGKVKEVDFCACSRAQEIHSVLGVWPPEIQQATELEALQPSSLTADLGDVADSVAAREPATGFRVEPDLLLRHAAGHLYQEAHIVIARDDQLFLPGMASDHRARGKPRKEAHFTPLPLARALVEQALSALPKYALSRGQLEILDPACGSGVFLVEALRELQRRCYRGKVTLRGFDISPVSCVMARFCLTWASREAQATGVEVQLPVRERDALSSDADWGTPDLVVMNPPFAAWETMEAAEKKAVGQVLGKLRSGRADKAMAFFWKGLLSLRPGGVLACVLPAALFETEAGMRWRKAIADQADILLLGRLQGYEYFQESAVEPGFALVRRPTGAVMRRDAPTRILLSDLGSDDAALRAVRKYSTLTGSVKGDGWELVDTGQDTLSAASWLPRHGEQVRWLERLGADGLPSVGRLFAVHQGMRTGRNRAFVLPDDAVHQLPNHEVRFFRPIASNRTITRGVITYRQFVFHPFGKGGLTLTTEDQLQKELPHYYARWLQPQRDLLRARAGISKARWWVPTRPRTWQQTPSPKLVSTYFGRMGSFAYDQKGECVVLQGHAWLWRGRAGGLPPDDFLGSGLPLAYLALLNSPLFDALLACYCPRVRGGQYNLSKRFVDQVYLPDLSDDLRVPGDVVDELANLGARIHNGQIPPATELTRATARAYKLSRAEAAELTTAQTL